MTRKFLTLIACVLFAAAFSISAEARGTKTVIEDTKTLRVFIFAGQSNMVGTHSSAKDVKNFPPFVGCGVEQPNIKYSYAIGRENMMRSNGWTTLKPVNNVVGSELSFGQKVSKEIKAPIAIIKCASGGTGLANDWNPDNPSGFKLYPIALKLVKDSLKALDDKKIKYRVEGFMWHQGENDMFVAEYKANYAKNLKNFIAKWRNDLNLPQLRFYIGELSTKTVWGMDNRSNMHTISLAQKKVCQEDDLVEYIPTNHVGIRTKSNNGLHYHYGTLGQLEHGHNYATAYLNNIGKLKTVKRSLKKWPYKKGSTVKLFVLAGHRNMEGEISFVENLKVLKAHKKLAKDNRKVALSYSLGGGYKVSNNFEPLGPAGMYDTFGPELSFASNLQKKVKGNIAIAKFTHSGSQITDWTPEGSQAKSRNLYPAFIAFVQSQVEALEEKGHKVKLEGIFYHVGENDMCFPRYKTSAANWVKLFVEQSRKDLKQKDLKWFISQQRPTKFKGANKTDVMAQIEEWAKTDTNTFHIKALGLVKEDEHILMDTEAVVKLGLLLSNTYLAQKVDAPCSSPRIVNIINFIRQCEPRIDWITEDVLYDTVVSQIKIMKKHQLKGTFLLQYDALIDARYQKLLKELDADMFEIGVWWEIPQPLVENSGYKWRGRYRWDWHADVGFATGYSPKEREKLVDTYMADFKKIFGYYPKSVGSWFIDAHTLQYMYDRYGIVASCNCKDQIGTDGYTLWGGYWNQGYYPSKRNAYMPAQNAKNQIPVPIFRMLGSDPIHQYDNGLGTGWQRVVSLEPVYKGGGGNADWCKWYFDAFVDGSTMGYGYVQTGQENSFTWKKMGKGFEIQMPMITELLKEGKVTVQTLAETGKWFKDKYKVTPPTSVTVLKDHSEKDQKTVWFNSRFYRANLLWDQGTMRFRDIHLFDETIASDYLTKAGTSSQCFYDTLPVVDGFRWSSLQTVAGLRLKSDDGLEIKGGIPTVDDNAVGELTVTWPIHSPAGKIIIKLNETSLSVTATGDIKDKWFFELSRDEKAKLPYVKIERKKLSCIYKNAPYTILAKQGAFTNKTGSCLQITPEDNRIVLDLSARW